MLRYCPNCGTEVDETAIFCPTCGQAIDQAAETQIPPAPAWPEPEAQTPPTVDDPARDRADVPRPAAASREPASVPSPPVEPINRPSPATGPGAVNMPVTLSGWLIGGGSVLGAMGALIGLFDALANPAELILLVALAAVAATVFAAAVLPAIPQLRLTTLVIVLVGFGVALDRIGIGGAGIGTLLLFLGTAAAGIGAIILELGRDQPLGGP